MKRFILTIAIAVVFLAIDGTTCQAQRYDDIIELRSGSKIYAHIIDRTESDNRKFVIFETESGSVVKLGQKLIASVVVADADQNRYYALAEKLPKTVEANWEIIDWCKSQSRGRSKFKDQIQYHLESIISIDPNERKARQLLGYEEFEGQWTLKALRYQKYGYVREDANWIPELALKIERNAAQQNAKQGGVKERFSRWKQQVRKGRLSASELQRTLSEIVKPESVAHVFEEGGKDREQAAALRKIYVEAFGQAPSPLAASALVYFGITDADIEVRERAVTLLLQPEFDQNFAMSRLVEFLDSKSVLYSERAATAIREISQVPGSDPIGVLRPLIESLVAVREVPIAGATPAGSINTGFSSNGGLSFATGGGPQTRKQEVQNGASLSALQRITGKNLGYDKEKWQNFFVDNFTVPVDGVRGDK